MSLLSSLKRLFLRSPKPAPSPVPARSQAKSRVPQVGKPMTMPATQDQLHVEIPRVATAIAPGMVCDVLSGRSTSLKALPDEIEARVRIDLRGSAELASLPHGLRTGSLHLADCTSLESLPSGMEIWFLNLNYCTRLKSLPDDLRLLGGGLTLRGCTGLSALPDGLGEVAYLDLSGCTGITDLPEGLKVTSWMNLTSTGITSIPEGYQSAGLRADNGTPLSVEEAIA